MPGGTDNTKVSIEEKSNERVEHVASKLKESRQSSVSEKTLEKATDNDEERLAHEAKLDNVLEQLQRSASIKMVTKQADEEKERRVQESKLDDVLEQLQRSYAQKQADAAMDAEKARRIREELSEEASREERNAARRKQVDLAMDREKLRRMCEEYDSDMRTMEDNIAEYISAKSIASEDHLDRLLEAELERISLEYERRIHQIENDYEADEERTRRIIEDVILTSDEDLERKILQIEADRAVDNEQVYRVSDEKTVEKKEEFEKEKDIAWVQIQADSEQERQIEVAECKEKLIKKATAGSKGEIKESKAGKTRQSALSELELKFREIWERKNKTPDSSHISPTEEKNDDPEIKKRKQDFQVAMNRRAFIEDTQLSVDEEKRAKKNAIRFDGIVKRIQAKLDLALGSISMTKKEAIEKRDSEALEATGEATREFNIKRARFLADQEQLRRIREEAVRAEIAQIELQASAAKTSAATSFERARRMLLEQLGEEESNLIRRKSQDVADKSADIEQENRNRMEELQIRQKANDPKNQANRLTIRTSSLSKEEASTREEVLSSIRKDDLTLSPVDSDANTEKNLAAATPLQEESPKAKTNASKKKKKSTSPAVADEDLPRRRKGKCNIC